MSKPSIRFFDDREERAVWDSERAKWWFSVLDIIGVLNDQDDYTKNRNYWKYLKAKLKLPAPDGKRRLTDTLDYEGVVALAGQMPNACASRFIKWFIYSDETLDGQSKAKALIWALPMP
jgi:hypothetical protein